MNKQGFLKGSAILLVSIAFTKTLGLLYRIPLTRLLGGSGMGYYSSAFCLFTPVMALAAAGIPSAMARLAAEDSAFERYAQLRKTKRVAMRLFTGIGLACAAVVALLAVPAAELFTGQKNAGYCIACLAPALVFCSAMSVERGYYEGLHNMYPTAVSEIIETIFKLLLGIGFSYGVHAYALREFAQKGSCFGIVCSDAAETARVSLPFSAAAAVLGTSLSSGIACIYIIVRSKLRGDGITPQMLRKDTVTEKTGNIVRRLLSYSMPVSLAALITTLTGMIDMLTVNPCAAAAVKQAPQKFAHLLSDSLSADMLPNFIYGSYTGLAVAVAGLVPTLTAMLGKSALAGVIESFAKGDTKAVGHRLNKMLTLCSMIAFPSAMGISLMSRQILELLFSGRTAEIAAAAPSLRILGAAVLLMSLSLPCFTIMQALGKSKQVMFIMLCGGAVKLCANVLLIRIPAFTLTGAAVSTVISEMFICICTVVSLYKTAGAVCSLKNVILRPLYAGSMASCAAYLSEQLMRKWDMLADKPALITLLAIFFSVIMYLIVVALLCEMPKSALFPAFYKKKRKNT